MLDVFIFGLLSLRALPFYVYFSFICYMCVFDTTLVPVADIAHLPGWLPNRFNFLHPLGFVVTTGSALRPDGLSTAYVRKASVQYISQSTKVLVIYILTKKYKYTIITEYDII